MWKLSIFTIVALWALSLCASPAAATMDPAAAAFRIAELTNQERAKAGLLPLKWNDTLAASALAHAQDMARRNYFSHTSPEGTRAADRARAAGYPAYGGDQVYVGENLARNFPSPEGAIGGWMASPSHQENLLLPSYREIGVGVVVLPNGASYWVQVFGSRPNVLPVFVNGDAATTDSPLVTLSISSEEVSNWGSLDQIDSVMVSNTPDFGGANWEQYSSTVQWRLANAVGPQTVYVRLRDIAGRVVAASDEIRLTAVEPATLAEGEASRQLLSATDPTALPEAGGTGEDAPQAN